MVPVKDGMQVTTDARILCQRATDPATIFRHDRVGTPKPRPDGTMRWAGQVSVVGLVGLCSYDQYGTAEHANQANRKDCVVNPINAVVVPPWAGTAYAVGHEPVFVTSLPVTAPLTVLDLYDLRSLIENTAFRELKQGWCVESYPKKTLDAVRTAQGQRLAQQGIRRQRAEAECGQVVVFAGEPYGLFDIEEVCILRGVEPATCLRVDPAEVRRRYRLTPAEALPRAA